MRLFLIFYIAISVVGLARLTHARNASPRLKKVLSGREVTLKCQLYDGSQWSRCVWKHGSKSAKIWRDATESGSEPYDTASGRVTIEADFSQCNLIINNVNKSLDGGKWSCTVTKNVDGVVSWTDRTTYNLTVFHRPQIKLTPLAFPLTVGISQNLGCKVRHGNLKPMQISVVRDQSIVLEKSFSPKAKSPISADDQEFFAQIQYTPTLNDTYGKTKVVCRSGDRFKNGIPFPEVRFPPNLIESNVDLGNCQNQSRTQTMVRLLYRANPLPSLQCQDAANCNQQVYLLVRDPLNHAEDIKYLHGIQVFPTPDRQQVVVLVNATKLGPRVALYVRNDVGSSKTQLYCQPTQEISALSDREISLAIGCSTGVAFVVLLLLVVWLSYSRRKCCYARKEESSCKIVVEESPRGRRQQHTFGTQRSASLENQSFPTKLIKGPVGGRQVVNNNTGLLERQHTYEEIPMSSCPPPLPPGHPGPPAMTSSGYLKADAADLKVDKSSEKERARQDSGFETNSNDTEKTTVETMLPRPPKFTERQLPTTSQPMPPPSLRVNLPPSPHYAPEGIGMGGKVSASMTDVAKGQYPGYEFNPFKCDTKENKKAQDVSLKKIELSDGEEENNGEYNKLDFDRALHDLRPHYQSSETLKPIRYSTQI